MTLVEVAEYLQVKERTLYQWVREGKIPGFQIGSMWRFKKEDIEQWIEERKEDASHPHEKRKARGNDWNPSYEIRYHFRYFQ
jgi:excisionase family DNA binding protein